jgi:predicted RNA polymerase sigma factor
MQPGAHGPHALAGDPAYDALLRYRPHTGDAVNRAVALAEVAGPPRAAALALAAEGGRLNDWLPYQRPGGAAGAGGPEGEARLPRRLDAGSARRGAIVLQARCGLA